MSTLLTIPRELRDKILRYVISTERAAPQNPEVDNRREFMDVELNSWFPGVNIMYEKQHNKTTELPTLLVNHQLHIETLEVLSLLPTKHCYALDLILLNEEHVCPTWLSVPEVTTKVDKLYAAVRTMTTGENRDGFEQGCGGPQQIVWCFYGILERFLRVGPVGLKTKSAPETPDCFGIKMLELDFITPAELTPQLRAGFLIDWPEKTSFATTDEYAIGA